VEKALVAQRVANQLAATENSVDVAMKETSQLLTGLIDARSELKLSAVFGDEALRAGIRTKLNVGDKPPSLSGDQVSETVARRVG
jgi:hypothetical protein